MAGAAVIGGIYAACVGRFMSTGVNTILVFPLISAVGALVSMVGDLAASAIKRNHNIKDYGKLIPGHGGILTVMIRSSLLRRSSACLHTSPWYEGDGAPKPAPLAAGSRDTRLEREHCKSHPQADPLAGV